MPINYELIYQAKAAGVNTNSQSNVEVSFINEARKKAAEVHKKYLDFLVKELGSDVRFEVTNIACMAEGIISHVYVGTSSAPRGLGKRTCCFCGCNDFDD